MIQIPDKLLGRIKWPRLSFGLGAKKKNWAIIALSIVILAVLAALTVLARGKAKSADPVAMTPTLPDQVVTPDLAPQEPDISVKPKSEQAVEKAPLLTKTQTSTNPLQGQRPKKKHALVAEKKMPSASSEDEGWKIRK